MRKLLLWVVVGLSIAVPPALSGCGFKYHFKPAVEPQTQEDREASARQYKQDKAACLERGYALQTYSGRWGGIRGERRWV
jgi:hypothetical protein